MKRDFKEKPKCIFSVRQRMKKFIDCLNDAEIFNEKIPYMVIHNGENRIASKMEIELTFKEELMVNYREKDVFEYISKKLDNLQNFTFNYGKPITTIMDITDSECYRSYLVVFLVSLSDKKINKNEKVDNNCELRIQMYNKDIPEFELIVK